MGSGWLQRKVHYAQECVCPQNLCVLLQHLALELHCELLLLANAVDKGHSGGRTPCSPVTHSLLCPSGWNKSISMPVQRAAGTKSCRSASKDVNDGVVVRTRACAVTPTVEGGATPLQMFSYIKLQSHQIVGTYRRRQSPIGTSITLICSFF